MNTTTTAPSDREGHDAPSEASALVHLVDGAPPPDSAKPGEPDAPRRTRTSQARQPVLFSFDGLPVRTLKIKGEPWFVTADVCAALEIANNRDVLTRLAADEKGVGTTDTLGGAQRVSIVNESGLYNLIFSSRRPEAQRFRRWVTGEVLPSIRKTGAYRIDHETRRVRDVLSLATGHARSLGLKGAQRLDTARAVVAHVAPDLLHLVPTAPPPRANARRTARRSRAPEGRSAARRPPGRTGHGSAMAANARRIPADVVASVRIAAEG